MNEMNECNAVKVPEVRGELSAIDSNIDTLDGLYIEIEKRISTILHYQMIPVDADKESEPSTLCECAKELRTLRLRIATINDKLRIMLNAIEL